jgi:hypothetical protein
MMEVPMGAISRNMKSKVIRIDGVRMVAIPEEFFLVGEEITVHQGRDAEEWAKEELWASFNPFVEWEDDTWPKEKPSLDW